MSGKRTPKTFEFVGRLHYARQLTATIVDLLGRQADTFDEGDNLKWIVDDIEASVYKLDVHLRPMLDELLALAKAEESPADAEERRSDGLSLEQRYPDGMHTVAVGLRDGWAAETFPAQEVGYWYRIVRPDAPGHGCPRRAVAEEAAASAVRRIVASQEPEDS